MFIGLNQRGTAVTPPLLENAFLKKLLVSRESHFLIGRSSHLFSKPGWRDFILLHTDVWSLLVSTVFRVKTQLCVKHVWTVPSWLHSWNLLLRNEYHGNIRRRCYPAFLCLSNMTPLPPPTCQQPLLRSYTGMRVHCISKGIEDKIPFRSYLAVCARNREGEESLVFSFSNSSKYTGHS